jgi:hypothetical protein
MKQIVVAVLFSMILGGGKMTTILATKQAAFQNALVAHGRSPEIAEVDDLYGWLIGSWDLECYDYFPDGSKRRTQGEVHFAWVLEGRAMQDIWIMPRRSQRPPKSDTPRNTYGTTLRVWDPALKAWRITWINPASNYRDELIGRRRGKDIVQVGTHADGTPIRWIFSEITPNSFRWTGEALASDGKTWKMEAEFHATRLKGENDEQR